MDNTIKEKTILNKSISILGCGWLGLPFGEFMLGKGYVVKGSTTTLSKLDTLQQKGIQPFLFIANKKEPDDSALLRDFLKSDILFLNIPFRRSLENPSDYLDEIVQLLPSIEKSPIKRLIFASSTSVYPNDGKTWHESDAIIPETIRSKVLLQVEQTLLNNAHFDTTIIRFAGLYGPKRPSGQFLAGRKEIARGKAPVNLIHLDDCIHILDQLLNHSHEDDIFNAVSDGHPLRKEYYTKRAIKMGLPVPLFSNEDNRKNIGKIVSNNKIKTACDYSFIQNPSSEP
ncbi:MAG: SDR family oxidoreductase [Candidatus Margulisbacteria bacterium]|nr:SDR family oxidoreductase [Candidatus Margulisiibacteriota bacterium]